jgi:hypothetical protein
MIVNEIMRALRGFVKPNLPHQNLSHQPARDALWPKRDECEERGAVNIANIKVLIG